jgi:hypothetical protein
LPDTHSVQRRTQALAFPVTQSNQNRVAFGADSQFAVLCAGVGLPLSLLGVKAASKAFSANRIA